MRAWHLVLADRFVERGWIDRRDDYFLLELTEVKRAVDDPRPGRGLRAIAARRAAQLAAERDLQMPLLMRESELPALLRPTPARAVGDRGDRSPASASAPVRSKPRSSSCAIRASSRR